MPSPLLRPRARGFAVPAEPFRVTTSDGVDLVGSRLGSAGTESAAILCHGFTGWHAKPRYARLAEGLAGQGLTVYAFDFRGHGGSGGVTTYGALEVEDVQAVVDRVRSDGHERVVTIGASMGGVAVLRHAGLLGGIDAVVAISSPARWEGHRSDAVRRMQWMTGTPRGRRLARLIGVRLPSTWDRPESPEDVVGKIAPVPLLLVHGRDDHFFDEEEAWRLYRAAGEPKRLLLAARFGHAEDGFSPELAERIGRFIHEAWEVPWRA
jgi:alpha-beta hydrolase superfamily lysophospholipase